MSTQRRSIEGQDFCFAIELSGIWTHSTSSGHVLCSVSTSNYHPTSTRNLVLTSTITNAVAVNARISVLTKTKLLLYRKQGKKKNIYKQIKTNKVYLKICDFIDKSPVFKLINQQNCFCNDATVCSFKKSQEQQINSISE